MKRIYALLAAVVVLAGPVRAQLGVNPQMEIIMSGAGEHHAGTITNLIGLYTGLSPTFVFDAGEWTISNNIAFEEGMAVRVVEGTHFWIGSTATVSFATNNLYAGEGGIFYGPGTVTGVVNGVNGCWTNWNQLTTANLYYLQCVGIDPTLSYLTSTTVFTGDVAGVYNNLQLQAGVVGTTELANGSVGTQKMDETALNLLTNPIVSAAQAYAFYVARATNETWTLYNKGYNTSNRFMNADYDYGSGWQAGLAGSNYVTPVAGVWSFTASFGAAIPDAGSGNAQYCLGIWVDSNNDGVMQTTEYRRDGSCSGIDLSQEPWFTSGGTLAFSMSLDRQLTNGTHVYPYIYYTNYSGGGPVTFGPTNLAAAYTFSGFLRYSTP